MQSGLIKILFLLSLVANLSHASNPKTLFEYALQNNPSLLLADVQKDSALAQKEEAIGNIYPTIDYTLIFTDNTNDTGSNMDSIRHQFRVQQTLFNGEVFKRLSQFQALIDQSEIGRELARQNLMMQLAQVYVSVLLAQTRLDLANQELEASKKLADRARQRLKYGSGTSVDVLQAEADLKLSESSLLSIKNSVKSAFATLNSIVGKRVDHIEDVRFSLESIDDFKAPLAELIIQSKQNNRQLQQGRQKIKALEKNADAVAQRTLPTANLAVSWLQTEYQTQSPLLQNSDNVGIQFSLNWVLYSGGVRQAQHDQAIASVRGAKYEVESTEREIISQLEQLLFRIDNGVEQVPALQALIEARESAFAATQESLSVGLSELVEVVNARRNVIASKTDLRSAQLQLWLDLLQLKFLTGVVQLEDL